MNVDQYSALKGIAAWPLIGCVLNIEFPDAIIGLGRSFRCFIGWDPVRIIER